MTANEDHADEGALSPYTVLDLTDGPLSLCAKLLADLGADVIKIEKPCGDGARAIGPFLHDMPHSERSLFWWAYNVNKRGITLNLDTCDGREIFKSLVKRADFVVESFTPGFLEQAGLGYQVLAEINPGVILASISPYGQTGPKATHPWSDLTAWASGGAAYITGDADRPPVAMSFLPIISAQAASEAVTALLIANYERETSGQGQSIDLSIQESSIGILQGTVEAWDLARLEYKRLGGSWSTSGPPRRLAFECLDGYAILLQGGGGSVRMVAASNSLVEWMSEADMAPDWLRQFDWANDYVSDTLSEETVNAIEGCVAAFLATRTKQEIYREGARRGIMIAPVNDLADVANDEQLAARLFWERVDHPAIGETVTYCGAFAKMSESPLTTRRPPPGLGEHNLEIYEGELGMSRATLAALKSAGAI